MKKIVSKPFNLLLLLIITTFIIRLIVAYTTGLGIGEAYYFRGAVDLQLSYFDQPPLFFWASGFFVKYFGLSTLTLRLPAVLFFCGTTFLVYLSAKKIYDRWAAFWAAFTLNLSFVFTFPVAVWYQPDAPLMFFWMLSMYCLINLFFTNAENRKKKNSNVYFWWILLGIAVGLATLSKYHSAFLIVGVALFIVLKKEFRHWLKHPGLYISALIAMAFLLPIIIWNQENNWVSLLFQGSRATSSEGFKLHPEWFLRNILGQAVWLAPWIWYPLVKELFKSFKQFKIQPKSAFIFSLSVLPIVFFTIITLWSNSQYHFHWQAPGYLVLFIPLGYTLSVKLKDPKKTKRTKRWLIISSAVVILIPTFFVLQMNTGFWQKNGPREIVQKFGGKYDPTMEGYDFEQIKKRFEKEGWLTQDRLFVGTTRWWQTGKIDWALKGEKDVVVFSNDPRNFAFFSKPAELIGYDAVVIRFSSKRPIIEIQPFFNTITRLEDIEISRRGGKEMTLEVYYCEEFKIPENYDGDFPVYRQLLGKHPFYDGVDSN